MDIIPYIYFIPRASLPLYSVFFGFYPIYHFIQESLPFYSVFSDFYPIDHFYSSQAEAGEGSIGICIENSQGQAQAQANV